MLWSWLELLHVAAPLSLNHHGSLKLKLMNQPVINRLHGDSIINDAFLKPCSKLSQSALSLN
jgi:hypothetical protein